MIQWGEEGREGGGKGGVEEKGDQQLLLDLHLSSPIAKARSQKRGGKGGKVKNCRRKKDRKGNKTKRSTYRDHKKLSGKKNTRKKMFRCVC